MVRGISGGVAVVFTVRIMTEGHPIKIGHAIINDASFVYGCQEDSNLLVDSNLLGCQEDSNLLVCQEDSNLLVDSHLLFDSNLLVDCNLLGCKEIKIKPKSDFTYHLPIDLEPSGRPFVLNQSENGKHNLISV